MKALDYRNGHCEMAARMLNTEAGLLDYRLIEYLNRIAWLVSNANGVLVSRQVIAAAIITWQERHGDDFTKLKQKG